MTITFRPAVRENVSCAICYRPIRIGDQYAAMQVFSMHLLCALRFIDRTPEQEHDVYITTMGCAPFSFGAS